MDYEVHKPSSTTSLIDYAGVAPALITEYCMGCGRKVKGILYYGYCSENCWKYHVEVLTYNKESEMIPGATGMQSQPTIHEILTQGKIHGVVRCMGVNFGIVADSMVDPTIFAKAASYFHDIYMHMLAEQMQASKGVTYEQGK